MGKPYSVARSIVVRADAARVHALVNDFRHWTTWSPWEDLDPSMERTYRGPESGTDAQYEWSGNKQAGSGTMRITNVTDDAIAIDLHFVKPFPAENRVLFSFVPVTEGDDRGATKVTWSMEGEVSGVMRVFTKIRPMDALIGPDFERGLAQLKAEAEG
ncbi:SRPBCC family protein [Aestuariimicrobium soli]|uniref:SRPBCC family protein n=1 Tax=Aestuariimicrobium soli TaxID=2035834 RepID=UPI003EC0C31A